jgi:hypothetical protein
VTFVCDHFHRSTSHKFNVHNINAVHFLHNLSTILSIAMASQTVTANMERTLKTFLEEQRTDAEGRTMVKQLVRQHLIFTGFVF